MVLIFITITFPISTSLLLGQPRTMPLPPTPGSHHGLFCFLGFRLCEAAALYSLQSRVQLLENYLFTENSTMAVFI